MRQLTDEVVAEIQERIRQLSQPNPAFRVVRDQVLETLVRIGQLDARRRYHLFVVTRRGLMNMPVEQKVRRLYPDSIVAWCFYTRGILAARDAIIAIFDEYLERENKDDN